jgi:hypothetical protein
MGYNAVYSDESQPTFRRNIASIFNQHKAGSKQSPTATWFMLVSWLAYSSSLKMEAT